MAAVLTRCPRTGGIISTGITTDMVQFDSLPNVDPGYRNGEKFLAGAAVVGRH